MPEPAAAPAAPLPFSQSRGDVGSESDDDYEKPLPAPRGDSTSMESSPVPPPRVSLLLHGYQPEEESCTDYIDVDAIMAASAPVAGGHIYINDPESQPELSPASSTGIYGKSLDFSSLEGSVLSLSSSEPVQPPSAAVGDEPAGSIQRRSRAETFSGRDTFRKPGKGSKSGSPEKPPPPPVAPRHKSMAALPVSPPVVDSRGIVAAASPVQEEAPPPVAPRLSVVDPNVDMDGYSHLRELPVPPQRRPLPALPGDVAADGLRVNQRASLPPTDYMEDLPPLPPLPPPK
jgi:hypothetical protein